MNKIGFNIFGQLQKELDEYFDEKIKIAGVKTSDPVASSAGFEYSQWETLNTIELYYNSKFESGNTDSEGQRKVFLNISQFKADVASKQVDIDVKDFVFVPDEPGSEWGSFFLTKKFRRWAKKNYFGQLINEIVMDYPKYGSAVIKKVGDELERVPLMTFRVKQDAKNLQDAEYVIEEHQNYTYTDIENMPEWNAEDLDCDWDDKFTIYERYGRVPLSWYKAQKDEKIEDGDSKKSIDVMAILAPTKMDKKNKEFAGAILFLEAIDERPYEEVHWNRIDGRWMGQGEIEKQFEEQVFRNMVENLRRRGLLWAGKKVFESTDTEIAKNLVKDVKDGEILKIMPNGNIRQVNTSTQSLAEFEAAARSINENSNQKAFTFESATGESMPSGTPFRLGVIMSNAVNAHFALKRENLGLFFERVVYELLFPVFKKQNNKAETMIIPMEEEGINDLVERTIKVHTWENYRDQLLKGILPDPDLIEQEVRAKMMERKNIATDIPEKFWNTLKVTTQLVITGEGINVEKRLETLTNLYNVLAQTNPEAAERVLGKILALTGENKDILTGTKMPQQNPALAGAGPMAGAGGLATALAGAEAAIPTEETTPQL